MTSKVSVADVERVAELANLELTSEEIPGMVKDLNAILTYVADLNHVDTAGVMPLSQISELHGSAATPLRSDQIRPSLSRASVMAEAPESDGEFFKVPKVIER